MNMLKKTTLFSIFIMLSLQSKAISGDNSKVPYNTCMKVQEFFNRTYGNKDRIFHDFDRATIRIYNGNLRSCLGGYMTERTPLGISTCYIYATKYSNKHGEWGYGYDSPSIMEGLNSRRAKDWCRYKNFHSFRQFDTFKSKNSNSRNVEVQGVREQEIEEFAQNV